MNVDAIRAALAALRNDPAMRTRGIDALAADGPLTDPMARWAFDAALGRFTGKTCATLANDRYRNESIAVLLAASVPTAPIRAVVLPLLAGAARVLVRPPSRQPRFTAVLVEALASLGCVELFTGMPGAAFIDTLASDRCDRLIAYGRDETLAAIEQTADARLTLELHGHGFGIAWVDDSRQPAAAVASDIAHDDQRGCLSPQTVFVRGDATEFARALSHSLARLGKEFPRAPLDLASAAAVVQWQGRIAAEASFFDRQDTHSVAALEVPRLVGSPGARNVCVVPAPSLASALEAVGPMLSQLTTVGVAGDLAAATPVVQQRTLARVVPAGTMQDPPLDGPDDPRPPRVRPGRR